MMRYMRVVHAHPPQGQADEVARRWAAFFPERLRAMPGFQHAHFGVDRDTGAVCGVTIFDQKPDEATFKRLASEFAASLGTAAPPQGPEVAVYEIGAEV